METEYIRFTGHVFGESYLSDSVVSLMRLSVASSRIITDGNTLHQDLSHPFNIGDRLIPQFSTIPTQQGEERNSR